MGGRVQRREKDPLTVCLGHHELRGQFLEDSEMQVPERERERGHCQLSRKGQVQSVAPSPIPLSSHI